ncbi:nitrous oxide reductase accessory protein NosL [Psychromarinibacter sp. C21-152]|uniref:Nitrous oxide reductase accessory protein NosL n=1 Tax=Psychromarinibacter sediminicola TaxID=3033385 RepID=A0AAE3NUU6_9RHOB|nr:nitrous oxide reductase accessory protein NosL [Psychromarinibacter sediminicola]MDF0602431.1 nitrous oxide reductase accessory protein NosL [Psychromarinibacter sediminicola]
MTRLLLLTLSALALAACKEDIAELPAPVELTAGAVGHYCQMDLLTHDGPKGQIHLDGMAAPLFFSQVKDAIAYLHMPEQAHAVVATYVQDMAGADSWAEPAGWVEVSEAVYVIGSDRMGGMGAPEFVPFSDEAAARAFVVDHGGALRRFDEIAAADVLNTAPPEPHATDTDIAARLGALSRHEGSH